MLFLLQFVSKLKKIRIKHAKDLSEWQKSTNFVTRKKQ